MTLKYLDQSGFSLMLSLCYTWFRRGSGKQFEVPTRWGSKGRLCLGPKTAPHGLGRNLIGTLSLFGESRQLEVRQLDGSCTQAQVMSYLETLAESCNPEHLTVMLPFIKAHSSKSDVLLGKLKGFTYATCPPTVHSST